MNPTDAAFPFYATDNEGRTVQNSGMDIRTYAAIQAMNGIVAGIYTNKEAYNSFAKAAKENGRSIERQLANNAIRYTDELLSQLSKPKQ